MSGRLLLALLIAFFLVVDQARAQPTERTIALTFDDLPFSGSSDSTERRTHTEALLVALAAADAPATGFVNAGQEGEGSRGLLEAWIRAGHRLENHSLSHPHFNGTPTAVYLDDVSRGHDRLQAVLGDRQQVLWYRAPYNETGETAEKREALRDLLDRQGVRLAPFTVEHADWMFDAVYRRALAVGDYALAARTRQAYLTHLDSALAFAERLAAETFGREIPHVLLLHANRLGADALPAVLRLLAERSYTVVTLEEATADPAYDTPVAYEGRWGISWLHRWRVGLGLRNALRDEPEPPAWLVEAFETGG